MTKKLSLAQIIVCGIGFVMLIWFVNPMLAGVINIGNTVGAALFAGMFLCSFYWQDLKKIFHLLWKNIFARVFIVIVAGVLVISILCGLILTGFMIQAATKTPPHNINVFVLGCKVNGKNPSLMLKSRLDCAFEYLQDNPDSKCIVSGGQGEHEDITEAEAMFTYLTDKGISADRLYKETLSTSTEENIKFSAAIIRENNLGDKIVIATDGFHQMRAGILAENEGLIPYSASSATVWYLFPTYYMRELFALMNQIILE